MSRVMADCRRFTSDSGCSLTIIGEQDEVIIAVTQHAVSVHGHEDTPEFRGQIASMLEAEDAYIPGMRMPEPLPA